MEELRSVCGGTVAGPVTHREEEEVSIGCEVAWGHDEVLAGDIGGDFIYELSASTRASVRAGQGTSMSVSRGWVERGNLS